MCLAMQIHSSKGLCPIAFISKRRGRWSLMLHLCQLNYLFVAKPKHATDVRNEGDTNLLHPLNNPLTTLKPQYSIECKTWPVITALDRLFNFTMSQWTDRRDLSTHKIMICQVI